MTLREQGNDGTPRDSGRGGPENSRRGSTYDDQLKIEVKAMAELLLDIYESTHGGELPPEPPDGFLDAPEW